MKKNNLSTMLVLSTLATGCASMSGWSPIVDPRMDQHPESVRRDMVECKALADQASDITKEVGMGAGVGAVTGAA
ncbi:MAG: glycine zipper family protein, partial [Methylobacter sp.]